MLVNRMINYGLSALNIWAAWSTWVNQPDYQYFAVVPLAISLVLFLQQRDIDEMNKPIEKEDE